VDAQLVKQLPQVIGQRVQQVGFQYNHGAAAANDFKVAVHRDVRRLQQLMGQGKLGALVIPAGRGAARRKDKLFEDAAP
jgi:hypothetical protein